MVNPYLAMTRLSLGIALLSLTAFSAFSADSDPGYGPRPRLGSGPSTTAQKPKASSYFKPTMRYYGPGYTVAYRYVSWNQKTKTSSAFESEQFYLPASSARSMVAAAPRMTYYYDRTASSSPVRDGAAPVVRTEATTTTSTTASPVKEIPPIAGSKIR
jgi:hypothetical protein